MKISKVIIILILLASAILPFIISGCQQAVFTSHEPFQGLMCEFPQLQQGILHLDYIKGISAAILPILMVILWIIVTRILSSNFQDLFSTKNALCEYYKKQTSWHTRSHDNLVKAFARGKIHRMHFD
ncbi:hypothetical protein ACFL0L_01980 [Patescibacteria group bacterium]